MLNNLKEAGQFTGLVIRPGNQGGLAGIGNRPIVELLLQIDGETVEWSGSSTPVKVSLHYEAKADERLISWSRGSSMHWDPYLLS